MIVKSADPAVHEGASLQKMLNEIEALLANGYTLKSITECNGEIFAFLINESELRSGMGSRTTNTTKAYEGLKESIKQNGMWTPIDINSQGVVLDGHHRFKACQELGIEPKTMTKEFPDKPHEQIFVIDSNLRRRHLNNFQRTELALRSKSILQEIAQLNQRAGVKIDTTSVRNLTQVSSSDGSSQSTSTTVAGGRVDEQIAKRAGVSRDTVRKVEAIQQTAEKKPNLKYIVERARNGEISTNEAQRIINDIEDESEKQGKWYKLKEEVIKSDCNKCRDCGSILHLDVYTIDRYEDKYELENLETLCEDCHKLKRQFGGSGILAAFVWMFQHLTGMAGKRYFEYSILGHNILYDIIKNRELSPQDEEMKNNPYVKLKMTSDAELISKTRPHRKQEEEVAPLEASVCKRYLLPL